MTRFSPEGLKFTCSELLFFCGVCVWDNRTPPLPLLTLLTCLHLCLSLLQQMQKLGAQHQQWMPWFRTYTLAFSGWRLNLPVSLWGANSLHPKVTEALPLSGRERGERSTSISASVLSYFLLNCWILSRQGQMKRLVFAAEGGKKTPAGKLKKK